MAVSPEYRAYVEELFEPMPGVAFKRMFGGVGVFFDDRMFGLVTRSEQLFFKVDEESKPPFQGAGSQPFVYTRKGKPYEMPYWTVPVDAYDEPEAFVRWAELGMAAARRSALKNPKRPKRKKRG